MKKLMFLILLYLPVKLFAQEFDFRKVNWGMTPAQVMKNESKKPTDIVDKMGLFYQEDILFLPVKLIYMFDDNKLTIASYDFKNVYDVDNQYVVDFKNIKTALIDKYGTPSSDLEEWVDNLYKKDPNNYGFAVAKGALKYKTNWFKNKTQITLTLKRDTEGKISLTCFYSDFETIKKLAEAKKKDSGL